MPTWSTGRLVQILAGAVAGGLIASLGTRAVFGLNAVTFLVSALLVAQLAIPAHAGELAVGAKRGLDSFFRDARECLALCAADPLVSRLLVVLSEEHLHLPPAGFSWLIGAIGVGALIGPFIPNTLARDYRDARWLFVPYVIRGIGDVLLGVVATLPWAMLILFVYGLNTSTGMMVFSSTVQGAVPDRVRGRVFTLLDVSWNAMRLLSLVIGGLVVDTLGIRPLFWGGGVLLILTSVLGLLLLGKYDFRQE